MDIKSIQEKAAIVVEKLDTTLEEKMNVEEGKSKHKIFIGAGAAVVLVLIISLVLILGGSKIEGTWINSEDKLSTDRLKFENGTVFVYDLNITAEYKVDDTEIMIENNGTFAAAEIGKIGNFDVINLEGETYYPKEDFDDIVEYIENEYKEMAIEFKTKLEDDIIGDWKEDTTYYRFKDNGEFEDVYVDTETKDGVYYYHKGKYRIELGDDQKSVALYCMYGDNEHDTTWYEDDLEAALSDLEAGSFSLSDGTVEKANDEEAVTDWLTEGEKRDKAKAKAEEAEAKAEEAKAKAEEAKAKAEAKEDDGPKRGATAYGNQHY